MEKHGGREAYGSRSPLYEYGIRGSAQPFQDYLNLLNNFGEEFISIDFEPMKRNDIIMLIAIRRVPQFFQVDISTEMVL